MKQKVLTMFVLAVSAGVGMAAGDAAAGKAAYDKSCKSCHGPDGVANPAIAKVMKVEMKDLGSAEVQSASDADLKKVIAEGKGKMKPVKSVSGGALDNVVAHIRSFKK